MKNNSYNDFIQQPFYVEVEGSGKDKKYNLVGIENKGIVDNLEEYKKSAPPIRSKLQRLWGHSEASGDYAKAHILLYKEMYDPLLKSLNSMIKQGQGFNSAKEKPDYEPF